MKKKIEHILAGREKKITEEETILQPLPHQEFRFANPLVVLHHMRPETITPGQKLRIHPHPHRGFSPVTFMLQGEGFHRDSAGHSGTIKAGEVQWMFAGKGILHSEGPSDDLLKNGGIQELIQLWVNVPAADKWDEPFYQMARKEEQPQVLVQEGVDLRLASGSYDGLTGPLKSFTPFISVAGTIGKCRQVQFTANPGYWTLIYVAGGSISINQESVGKYHLVVFEKANDEILITAEEDSRILFLSAEPLDEPVAAKDNFVMNTTEEVNQAIEDYKNGWFGELAEY